MPRIGAAIAILGGSEHNSSSRPGRTGAPHSGTFPHKVEATIVRVQAESLAVLENVDPECFDEPVDPERAARCVASPDAILIVAVAAGTVVGQCLAAIHRHPDKATELYIDDLAVSPAFRRRGLATRLVRACIDAGRDAGAEEVWVATEAENEPASAFYAAFGLKKRHAVVFEGDT
jgi:aminoglycoside 6'-N-acetyltransferase I